MQIGASLDLHVTTFTLSIIVIIRLTLQPYPNPTDPNPKAVGKLQACRDAGFCGLLVLQKVKCANPNTITKHNLIIKIIKWLLLDYGNSD